MSQLRRDATAFPSAAWDQNVAPTDGLRAGRGDVTNFNASVLATRVSSPHDLNPAGSQRCHPLTESPKDNPDSFGSDYTQVPSTNEELQAAINALATSTKAIERRTAILNAQNSHARNIVADQQDVGERRARHVDRVNQKQAAELQHIKFANDQLVESLRADLHAELERVAKDIKSAPATVSVALNADDRALAKLNDLTSTGDVKQEVALDVDSRQSRVDKLIRALQHFQAKAMKDRLDRIYLESIDTAQAVSEHSETVSNGALKAVKEDLNSLYAEIDDVITMVVAHEHGSALQAAFQNIRRLQIQEKQTLSEQIHGTLISLTEKTTDIAAKIENLQSQRSTLEKLKAKIGDLDSTARSSANEPIIAVRANEQIIRPATRSLLQHLNVPTTPGSTEIAVRIDDMVRTLEIQSSHNIRQILDISGRAATDRRAALESATGALAANERHAIAVRILEQGIAAAQAEMEGSGNQR